MKPIPRTTCFAAVILAMAIGIAAQTATADTLNSLITGAKDEKHLKLTLHFIKPEHVKKLETAEIVKTQNRHFRDPQSAFYLCWQKGIINWLETQNPEALIVEANPRYLSTYGAIRWMKQRNRPVLGWGLGAAQSGNPVEKYFRQTFLKSLDGIISYSRRGADEYHALGLETVFVAHNAVSRRPQHPLPKRSLTYADGPMVLFVGRYRSANGLIFYWRVVLTCQQHCSRAW